MDPQDEEEKFLRVWLKKQRSDGDGEAVVSYEGGHFYKGTFSNGLLDEGVFILANGLKYEGRFACNVPMGLGTYTWPDGSTYVGEVSGGKRHGTGTHTSTKHGVSYTGQWHQGRRHGKGTMYYNEKKTCWYEGDWVMNNREGSGERHYQSGDVYSGEWKNNVQHGEGTMSWVELGQRYVGKWEHGVQHGHGKHFWTPKRGDGSQYYQSNHYEGGFFKGQRHGEGTFYYADGSIYRGEWKNNKKHGKGQFTSKDGRVFEGEFVDNKLTTPSLSEHRTCVFPVLASGASVLGSDMVLNINRLLEKIPERNREAELQQVENVVVRERSELRLIYGFYSRLGRSHSPDNTFLMSRLQFWSLLKDCNLHHHGLTLKQLERLIRDEVSVADVHSPFTLILLREFLSSLVNVAYCLYHQDMMSQKHILAACFSKLMSDDILPNAKKVKGVLFGQPEFAVEVVKYTRRCWEVFEAFCGVNRSPRDTRTMTFRQLMWMFKDLHLLDHQLTSKKLLEIMTAESRDLDLEITFLEFFEVLLGCAEARLQKVSDDLEEDQVLLRSDHQAAEKLADEKKDQFPPTGSISAPYVGNEEVKGHTAEQKDYKEENVETSRVETQSHQLQRRIQTLEQYFDRQFFPAVARHQLVPEKMEMFVQEEQNSNFSSRRSKLGLVDTGFQPLCQKKTVNLSVLLKGAEDEDKSCIQSKE